MTTQQQDQQPEFLQKRHSKRSYWRRWLIASIILLLVVVGIIIWVLTSRNAFTAILPIVIFTVLGVLIALFQWLFPVVSSAEHPSPHQHAHEVTPIIVHVPATQPLHDQTSLSEKTPYRGIVGLLPPTDPRTIQQREHLVREVYEKLLRPDLTAIALTGIGGVGKSTLAALIYRYVEEQREAHRSPFQAETLWLTIDPAVTFADLAGNLFDALGKPFLDLNNLAPNNQAVALFNALQTTNQPRLVILDQFETLLDWNTGHALTDRPGVGEWLDIINSQSCTCRLLLTSRPRPVGTREYLPAYLQEYPVGGLEVSEGVTLLRSQGVRGTDAELQAAVSRCAGHAFSLTLLALLMRDHPMNLGMLFNNSALWIGDIATNLLNQIYTQQLNDIQRKLLFAFSVYREPVPTEAAQTVIAEAPKVQQATSALKTLVTQHLLEADGDGFYQLHAIIADYVRSHYDDEDEQANAEALRAAHLRAAEYYLQLAKITCPPREKRREVVDIHDLIEGIWQLFQAEQWQEGYNLIQREGIFADLEQWGGNAIILELCQLLASTNAWHPEPLQSAYLYHCMGEACRVLGRIKQAQDYYESALDECDEEGNSSEKGWALVSLGRLYNTLGHKEQAQGYLEQALQIFREVGNSRGEANVLNNFGWFYADQGQMEQAQKNFEQALQILRGIGDRRGESSTLDSLGRAYSILGQKMRAREYYEQALKLRREIGDRNGEGVTLSNLGRIYRDLGQREQARECYKQALQILREVRDRSGEGLALTDLGVVQADLGEKEQARVSLEQALLLRKEVGNRRGESRVLTELGQLNADLGRREQAQEYYEQALLILKEVKAPWREGKVLNKLGKLNADLGRREQAWNNYREALNKYREVGDRWEEGETLYNIGILYFEQRYYDIALACFLLAKNIFQKVQSPLRDEAQNWIEKIHQGLGEEQFSTLLASVELRPQQIVDQALVESKLSPS